MIAQIRQVFRESTPAEIAGDCIGALSIAAILIVGMFAEVIF